MLSRGEIYAVPLLKGLGFAYVKLINTKDLGFNYGLILKVYDLHTQVLIHDMNEVVMVEELCYNMLMLNQPPMRGKYRWFKLGDEALSLEEITYIPKFKQLDSPMLTLLDNKDWSKLQWSVINGLDLTDRSSYISYDQIKEYGIWLHSSDRGICTRLTMIWIKRLNKNFIDFFPHEELNPVKGVWNIIAIHEAENLNL